MKATEFAARGAPDDVSSKALDFFEGLGVRGHRRPSERQVLVKDGRALEQLRQVDTVIFDKTGTLTHETLELIAIHPVPGEDEAELLALAAAVECRQSHPIARAIVDAAERRGLEVPSAGPPIYDVGFGLRADVGSRRIVVGSQRMMTRDHVELDALSATFAAHQDTGHSLVCVAIDGRLAGAIELAPLVRAEAAALITRLRARGLEVHIVSGDRLEPTRRLAQRLNVEHYAAETLPQDKAIYIERLRTHGRRICFVGDGINDSVALKAAHVSVSLTGASAIALDTAGVVLLDGTLRGLDGLFDLSAALGRDMAVNKSIAMIPGVICVGGALFFKLGVLGAIMLVNLSLAAGLFNAVRAGRGTPTGVGVDPPLG